MKKKIELPNNNFGAFLMLCLAVLVFAVPFVLALWLVTLLAPWWVGVPVAMLSGLLAFVCLVKLPGSK